VGVIPGKHTKSAQVIEGKGDGSRSGAKEGKKESKEWRLGRDGRRAPGADAPKDRSRLRNIGEDSTDPAVCLLKCIQYVLTNSKGCGKHTSSGELE